MDEEIGNRVLIREYSEERDFEEAMKLEKNCKIASSSNKAGISIFTNMIADDPLCRIRLYPVHVALIAELLNNGELVGMVRGCIKNVEIGAAGQRHVTLGCILGLRVSPMHRRAGIGLKLVQSMEEWLTINGANYTFLATEENNVASTSLFTRKCNYIKFSSLNIFVHPVNPPFKDLYDDIKIEKLPINQAISCYKTHLVGKDIYPTDINLILEEKLSLGTWLCYFKEENVDITSTGIISQSSWAIFSIWNTCEAYNLQVQGSSRATPISHAMDNPKMPVCEDSNEKPLGFLFLYGLYGEGKRLEELVNSLWSFALKMAENVKDCKAIMTELGFSDPLREFVPRDSSTSCMVDIWYVKRVKNSSDDGEEDLISAMSGVGNVFVDPRDF